MSSHVSYLEPDDATGNVQSTYEAVEQNFGQVLNLVKVLGNSPEGLDGVMSAMGALNHFDLAPKYVELAYLKASTVNACEY
jgi:alkylhydroperoxidase family enzyme